MEGERKRLVCFSCGERREENPGRSISMVYSRLSGDPKHTLPTSLKPQEPAVHTLKGPRSCQWIEVTSKASLSAAAWLESWAELSWAQPSQAKPSLRILHFPGWAGGAFLFPQQLLWVYTHHLPMEMGMGTHTHLLCAAEQAVWRR